MHPEVNIGWTLITANSVSSMGYISHNIRLDNFYSLSAVYISKLQEVLVIHNEILSKSLL